MVNILILLLFYEHLIFYYHTFNYEGIKSKILYAISTV